MGVKERAKKHLRGKDDNSTNESAKKLGVRERAALNSFTKEYGAWEKSANDFITNHNKRYFNGDGTYNDAYRADTSEWYQQVASQQAEIDSKRKELLGYLEDMRGAVADDVWSSYRDILSSDLSDLVEIARNDNDIMSQYSSVDEYDYARMSYQERDAHLKEKWNKNFDRIGELGLRLADPSLSPSERRTLQVTKEKLEAENAEYADRLRYNSDAQLSIEDLENKKDAAETADDKLYYLSLISQKDLLGVAEILGDTKMKGENTSVLDAMNGLAKIENKTDRKQRQEEIKARMADVGIDFDRYYSRITGESNVTAENFFNWLGTAAKSGLDSWVAGVTGTVDKVIGKPLESIFMAERTPLGDLADYYADLQKYNNYNLDYYNEVMGGGTGFRNAGEFVQGLTGAVPDAALALISGGLSKGTSLATTASQATGSVFTKAGITVQNMAKNPSFWSSFARTYSMDYEEAIALGASDPAAAFGSAISSLINAGIEIGLDGASGIQGLTQNVKNGEKRLLYAWIESSLQEGGEEILQGFVNNAVSKALYDSTVDLVDAEQMLKEGLIGTGVGAILGGGQTAITATANKSAERYQSNMETLGGKVDDDVIAQLQEIAESMDQNSQAYLKVQQLDSDSSALFKGETFSQVIREVYGNQSAAVVKGMLLENGASEAEAESLASAFLVSSENGYMSGKVKKAVRENPKLMKAWRALTNSTQRDLTYRLREAGLNAKESATLAAEMIASIKEGKISQTVANATSASEAVKEAYDSLQKQVRFFGVTEKFIPNSANKEALQNIDRTIKSKSITRRISSKDAPVNKPVAEREFSAEQSETTEATETAGIAQIASISDGVMTLELIDGSKVDAAEYVFASEDEALVYESVLHMGANAATANALVQQFQNGKASAEAYVRGIAEAYTYGLYGLAESEMSPVTFTADLSAEQRHTAYRLGQTDAKAAVAAEQAKIDNLKRAVVQAKSTGEVYSEDGTVFEETDKHTETQKASVRALKSLATALKLDFYVYESYEREVDETGAPIKTGVKESSRGIAKRSKTSYNEFASLAMRWANKADRQSGDATIIYDAKRKRYVMIEALERGYFEVTSGTYEEMRDLYERVYAQQNRGLYEDLDQTRSKQGSGVWNLQLSEDRGYDVGDAGSFRGEGFQADTAGNDEHLRGGHQGESTKYSGREVITERVYKTPDGTVEKAPNGFFVGSDSKIHIDLNAGLKGEGTMLYTVSHELGHFIKKWSPKKFKALADFLAKTYGKHGHSVVDLVREQQAKAKRNGREISFDEAYEEFVCDSLARMLTDGDAAAKIQALQKHDASIVAKIKEFFTDLASKLKAVRNAYKDTDPGSVEGRFINESLAEFDRLQQLFAEALVDAADAYNATEQTKNTAEDSGVKYELRHDVVDVNGRVYADVVALDYKTFNKVKRSNAKYIEFIRNNLIKKKITVLDQDGTPEVIEFAKPNERVLKEGAKNPHRVLGKLERSVGDVKKLTILNAEETIEISKIFERNDEHVHQWLDEFGWEKRESFVATDEGTIYPVALHIAKTADGRNILYEISLDIRKGVAIDKEATSLRSASKEETAVELATPSGKFIPQSSENVKDKLSDRDNIGRRLSAEQQEFFKDSKVRDENGNLIALYHGTENGGFTVFDAAKSDDGISLFFTDDLKVAETYSGSDDDVALPAAKPPMLRWTEGNTKRGKQQAGVYEVYLNLKNPLVVECEGKTWGSIPFGDGTPVDLSYHIKHGEIVFSVKAKDRPTQTVRFADNANTEAEVRKFLTKTFNKEIGKRYSEMFASVREDDADYGWKDSFERAVAFPFNWDFSNNTLVPTSTRGIAAQAKKEGYDGVIFRNLHDYGGHKVKGVSYASKKTTNIYVAFNKNTVKDVDNKTPTANKDIRYDDRDAIDKSSRQGDNDNKQYTEEQYNAFGWASYNGVLSAKERETLLSRFADFKHNRHNYPVTRWGEAVIHSTETPDVIVYVRSTSKIRSPEITRIVRILATDIDDVTEIRKEIILYEQKRVLQSYEALEAIYGEGIFRTSKKRNFASFQEYRSREEGRGGKAVVSDPGKQQDGGRSVRESESALREDGGVKLSDRDPAEIDRLRRVNQTLQTENEHLQEDVARLREVLAAQGEPVNGRRFSKTAVEAAATQLMQRAGARFRGDKAELVSMLNTVYDDLASDGDLRWETIAEKARPIVEWVQAHRPVDSVEQDYYRELTARELLADVYDSFWNATTLHAVAAEVDRLKGKHKQQMKALRERRDAKIKALKTEYRERIKRIREQKNAAIDREVLRTRETYRNTLEKRKEATAAREARAKLQKLVLDTAKWLAYPSKTDVKCPDILREPYAEFLSSIDLTSKRQLKGGEATHNDLRIKSAMDSLANAVDKVRIAQDPSTDVDNILDSGYLDLPAHFVAELRDMADSIKADMTGEHYVINEMKAEDIRKVSKLIRTLNHAIKEMGKIYATGRFANVQALGADSMTFMDELGELEKTSVVGDYVAWDNALPYYAFKRFGQGGEALFEALMDGQDKLAFLAKTIFDFRDANWTEKEAKAWSEDTHTIELPSGGKLTLTTSDAMSIYCLSRREQAVGHLLGGGVCVKGLKKGSVQAKDSSSQLTVEDIAVVTASLSDRQIEVANAIQGFMSTVCAEWGNEISMKRFLTREFTEKFYFPIESNDANLDTKDPSAQQSDLYRLLNISATKPTVKGANNEVIVRNIFDVFTQHASDMAKLNAFGLPVLDCMKWLNYRERSVNEDGQVSTRGVRKSMESAYGKAAKGYVINLVKDVNGRASDSGDPTIMVKWLRLAKTANVGFNLRVAALQLTAYPRAAMVLSTASLAKGLTKVPQIQKARKYCGIALWKSFGFYDTNIARSIEDQIKGTTDIRQKIVELSLKGAEYGDAITWGALWNACEYEVAATGKFKVGSEEFNEAVAKKLREVVYTTQVVDSQLTRSQNMRQKSGMAQEAYAFMSEPTVSANILMDAGFQFNLEKRRTGSTKQAWKKAGKHVYRAISVFASTGLMVALVGALSDAWRDDDDEEYGKKFMEAFGKNVILELLPFNKVPIIADMSEAALSLLGVGYFSTESMASQWLSQAVMAINAWKSVLKGNSSTSVYGALYKTVRVFSSFSGIALSGAMREAVALWNNTAGAIDSELKIRTSELSDAKRLNNALENGDAARARELAAEIVDEKMAKGKTATEAKASVRSSMTSYWKPLFLEAYQAKDNAEMARIRRLLKECGVYEDVIETTQNWIKSLAKK